MLHLVFDVVQPLFLDIPLYDSTYFRIRLYEFSAFLLLIWALDFIDLRKNDLDEEIALAF